MFKLDLEKAEEPEIKLPTSTGSQKKRENTRKTSTSASLTMLNEVFDWVDHSKLWEILKEMGYQATAPASCKTGMQVKKPQLEPDMEQWTGWISLQSKGLSRVFSNTISRCFSGILLLFL